MLPGKSTVNILTGSALFLSRLDSVVARRWINNMIYSLLTYDSDGNITGGIIPMVDGGTEGFKGNSRIICPTQTACLECNLDLYPPQVNYPLCTIASVPRQPEHCIEYARLMAWSEESPFGDVAVDGDNPGMSENFKVQPKHTVHTINAYVTSL